MTKNAGVLRKTTWGVKFIDFRVDVILSNIIHQSFFILLLYDVHTE